MIWVGSLKVLLRVCVSDKTLLCSKKSLNPTMTVHDNFLQSFGMVTNVEKTELIYFSRHKVDVSQKLSGQAFKCHSDTWYKIWTDPKVEFTCQNSCWKITPNHLEMEVSTEILIKWRPHQSRYVSSSDGSGSKFWTWVRLGQFFVARVSHLWFGFGKFSLKIRESQCGISATICQAEAQGGSGSTPAGSKHQKKDHSLKIHSVKTIGIHYALFKSK